MNGLKIEYVPVSAITPYSGNAKQHTQEQIEQIARSIEMFGMDDPIAVWGDKNIVIEGHGRLLALAKLGETIAPIIRLDHLTDEQRRAYALAHNQLTMNSGYDNDKLVLELNGIAGIDMAQFGFLFEEPTVKEDDFDGTVPKVPIARQGDIWLLGRHRLMCGDATSVNDVKRLMNGNSADMLLTDPPYNVSYEGSDGQTIMNDSMGDASFRDFLRAAFHAVDSVMKPGAAAYVWHADSEGYNFRGACLDADWALDGCIIWNKNAPVLGRQDYLWKHEPCLYCHKPGAEPLWAAQGGDSSVLNYKRPVKNRDHPTMKPVLLFDHLIQNSTRALDIVLDSFAGSGTTVVACEQNGRTAYVMELDPKYASVIIDRYIQLVGTDENVTCIRDGQTLMYSALQNADEQQEGTV